MKRLREQIKRIAPTDVSILISGENGSGKELVARAIHRVSPRAKNPFIKVNCRAMAEKRLEQELFGINGDEKSLPLLLQAHGGTLLLNDIFALPKSQQFNLLRFLQEGKVETALGVQQVDVRILAAHSVDIEKALIDGDFNEELYHYINVLRIHVPSLRERGNDVALLAEYFLKEYAKEYNAQARSFTEEALLQLTQYYWPGNVRELMNQIKRVVLMSDAVMLNESHLDLPKRSESKRTLKSIREHSEREALLQVLESHAGQVSSAAKELGISRATIYRLLNKHDLLSDLVLY